jgi:hypothetical protein
MANSQNSAVPKDASQQSDSVIDIPNEWREIQFQDLFANGWKPRIKTQKGISYITLRRGNKEKSLGPYQEDRWQLVMSMFPKKVPDARIFPANPKYPLSLIGATMKRADWVPKTFTPSVDTLKWFQTLKENGSSVGFDEFINDIVETHFSKCHHLDYRLVITEPIK